MLRNFLFAISLSFIAASASAQSFDARFDFGQASATKPQANDGVDLRLLADADRDGRFDGIDLLEAALVAGGTTDAQRRAAYRQQFNGIVDELRLSGRVVGTELDQARAVHEFLHARLLTGGFRDAATTVEGALDQGRFNCISSVILFRLAAEKFGLRVHGVEVPGHAYAVVETAAGATVVQTTCPAWFAVLGNDDQRRTMLQQTLGERAATDADRAPAAGRRLSDVGLAAIVFYNRGLDHLEAGRYAEALAANRAALQLDARNETARANLLATLNNWSLAEFRNGEAEAALRLLEQGLAVAPDYELFHENRIAVYQQTLAHAAANDVALNNSASPAEQRAALRSCYVRWHAELLRRGEAAEAQRVASRAEADPFLRATP